MQVTVIFDQPIHLIDDRQIANDTALISFCRLMKLALRIRTFAVQSGEARNNNVIRLRRQYRH